jgi:DNA-binding transcriptional ArsR family regulator
MEKPDMERTDHGSTDRDISDQRELLKIVIQDTRFMLIQTILGHPQQFPSLKEIVYANPSKSQSTIRNHLDRLIEHNIVTTEQLPKEERSRDLPYQFYRLTEEGRTFLERHDLLRSEEAMQELNSVTEKTPVIVKYEEAPRPDRGQSDERRLPGTPVSD